MKRIAILGSTGKIGSQTLEIVKTYPKDFKVIGLACGHKSEKFEQQKKEFKPEITAIANQDGEQGLIKVATYPKVDMVIVAVVGITGLKPTLEAIKKNKDIALATKEVLVIAGELVVRAVKKYKVNLLPLDSEHSAIFQSLRSGNKKEVKQIYLTMGKGPIAKMSNQQLKKVTIRDVFNRPAWTMGQKIAVDSASCINKVFEIIEAKWLFDLKPKQIRVVVHPEYLCHSLVEFVDGSIITELGSPDMRRYIQYALFYPVRKKTKLGLGVDLIDKKMTFARPPLAKFPCLKLGDMVLRIGGTMPAVLHGADRAAVDAFVKGKLRFTDIFSVINLTLKKHKLIKNPSLIQLIKAEKWGQDCIGKLIQERKK